MIVSVFDSFERLPEGAQKLGSAIARERWFDSFEWFQCLHETTLAADAGLRIYVLTSDIGVTVACLFCCTRPDRPRELASLSNFYTMEFGPVIGTDSNIASATAALADFIAAERPRWDSIRLDYLKEQNASSAALVDSLRLHGYSIHRHHQYENWFLDCPDMRFEEYFAARPSRLRNTIERKSRKLQKTHHVEFALYCSPSEDLMRGVQDYIAVYNSSWKQPEPHPRFIPELAQRLAKLGCLRLGVLYVDGRPVASQFWITTRNEACIYKLAYDEKFADLSVGAVLSREMFRHALDVDRVARIDYGVGSEPYKREWMSAMQEICGVRAYSWRSVGGILLAIEAWLKKLVRRMIPKGA
ncbi:MAG: GNAT family N-acetyltransferase [Steroidobacteraceae bacterium]